MGGPWSWGSALYRDYSALSKDKQASSGLCFDAEGTAYTLKFVNGLNREVFEHLVEDLSSYSWRRAGPTAATLMQFTLRCAHWATGQTAARLPRKPRCHSTIVSTLRALPQDKAHSAGGYGEAAGLRIQVRWDRFNLCSILDPQDCRTGVRV